MNASYFIYAYRALFDTLVTSKRKHLIQRDFKRPLYFLLSREFSLSIFKPYLLYKASIGHVPIYQSHPRAVFHTMSRTCISEALWTLWKPLSPKHQLMMDTEQEKELAVRSSQRRRNLKSQPIFFKVRTTFHTYLSRKRSFSETFLSQEKFENTGFGFSCERKTFLNRGILKTINAIHPNTRACTEAFLQPVTVAYSNFSG